MTASAVEAGGYPSPRRRTPLGAIPTRFLLALASSRAAVVCGPDRSTVVVEVGEPTFNGEEIAEAWDMLRRGIAYGRLSLAVRAS